jgi:DNA sulfur modification protein DndD
MILDELTLHNFGVYRGRQTFHLTPVSEERPVVLVGALNGNGKTTFLDALQLAFFGKLARGTGREGIAYEEYLRRSVHRAVSATEGAAVEVKFRRRAGGREHHYLLHRSWAGANGSMRERFTVVRDGWEDRALTEQWYEHLEDILPTRLAPLFFFDGEKIEQLADIERASEILSTAMQALLGLDIVERLQGDLQVFERRKRLTTRDAGERAAIEQATRELEALETQLSELRTRRAEHVNRYEQTEKSQAVARERFRAEGGELFEQREELVRAHADAAIHVSNAEGVLRQLASEVAPLLLVAELLDDISRQAETEAEADKAATVVEMLEDRDARLVRQLEEHTAGQEVIQAVAQSLAESRAELRGKSGHERYLGLSDQGRAQLGHLRATGLPEAREALEAAVAELDAAQQELDHYDHKLLSLPTSEAIEELAHAVHAAEEAVAKERAALEALDQEIAGLEQRLARQHAAVASALEAEVQHRLRDEDTERMLEHSCRVRETLGAFQTRVVEHHLGKLEGLIVECFNALVRKDPLIARVKIDPQTFALELKGGDWGTIAPERLSAGERQLLAVAILWALARASGRPAPAVIDTPLGRLDSVHRGNLLECYFPQASHQVILLSTDKEIDAEAYRQLEPALSRSFLIEFDPSSDGSSVHEGYFFEEQA